MKSANKAWKESGTTLSFSSWLTREKSKGKFIPDNKLNDEVQEVIKDENFLHFDGAVIVNNTTLGINNYILVAAGVIILAAVIYKISR